MKFNLDKTDYILYPESIYKSKVRFTLFVGVYWIWCLLWFGVAIFKIAILHNYSSGLWTGVINLMCLFLATLWIEDLINDH